MGQWKHKTVGITELWKHEEMGAWIVGSTEQCEHRLWPPGPAAVGAMVGNNPEIGH